MWRHISRRCSDDMTMGSAPVTYNENIWKIKNISQWRCDIITMKIKVDWKILIWFCSCLVYHIASPFLYVLFFSSQIPCAWLNLSFIASPPPPSHPTVISLPTILYLWQPLYLSLSLYLSPSNTHMMYLSRWKRRGTTMQMRSSSMVGETTRGIPMTTKERSYWWKE
jgi:hypothetical protein